MDDDERYEAECQKARAAASVFDRDVLRPQYAAFFEQLRS
jgi:hypothetical protein